MIDETNRGLGRVCP